jgi:hypothetical protein
MVRQNWNILQGIIFIHKTPSQAEKGKGTNRGDCCPFGRTGLAGENPRLIVPSLNVYYIRFFARFAADPTYRF